MFPTPVDYIRSKGRSLVKREHRMNLLKILVAKHNRTNQPIELLMDGDHQKYRGQGRNVMLQKACAGELAVDNNTLYEVIGSDAVLPEWSWLFQGPLVIVVRDADDIDDVFERAEQVRERQTQKHPFVVMKPEITPMSDVSSTNIHKWLQSPTAEDAARNLPHVLTVGGYEYVKYVKRNAENLFETGHKEEEDVNWIGDAKHQCPPPQAALDGGSA